MPAHFRMRPWAPPLRRFLCCFAASPLKAQANGKKNVVFLGSPQVATSVLNALFDASEAPDSIFKLAAIVTQPPAARDRGRKLMPSPVAQHAIDRGFPLDLIFTPQRAGEETFLDNFRSLSPDLCVTAAYGNMLPKRFLEIPPYGTVNIHPSLLPLYRGAAPVQRALQDGVTETGVSLAYTVLAMDSGPVIAYERVELDDCIKAPELLSLLFNRGSRLLIHELPSILDGSARLKARPQDDSKATLAPKFESEMISLCRYILRARDSRMLSRDISKSIRSFTSIAHSACFAIQTGVSVPARNAMCFGIHRISDYNRLRFQLGFPKHNHELAETKFIVEPVENDDYLASYGMQVSLDAERICKLFSKLPNSDIASCLDEVEITITPNLVAEVLKKLSNAGMLALAFFRWAEKQEGFKHTSEIFHHLIEALGKIKQFRLIWSLAETMKQKGLLRKETFALITRRYARARKIEDAVQTFEKMVAFGLRPELSDYNSFIDTLSKSRHVKRAQEIFDEMKRRKHFTPDLKTYTILLEGWGQDKNLSRLRAVYQEMLDEGFEPDVVTYGILINAFCKSGRCEEAVHIFNQMVAKHLKPSPHIYCSLINGLGSEKRLDEALKYFELSKTSGFAPEIPTYNSVIGAYCSVIQFDDAFRVMEEMKSSGVGPNTRTYDIILHHLIKAGKTQEAHRIFQRMSQEASCEPQLNTYTMMVSMFCSVERVDMALLVWKQMSEKGILPCMHMFSSLISGLCYENRLDDACRYFQEMLDKGIRPPGQLYSKLKEALLDGGRKDLAVEVGLKLERLRKIPLSG